MSLCVGLLLNLYGDPFEGSLTLPVISKRMRILILQIIRRNKTMLAFLIKEIQQFASH